MAARKPVIRRLSVRRRKRAGIGAFLRRHIKAAAAGAVVLTAGIICLVIFLVNGRTAPASEQEASLPPEPSLTLPSAEETDDYSQVDAATLAGLSGTDDTLFSDDEDLTEALLEQEGICIGVTVGSITSSDQELILNRLEQVSGAAEADGTVYKTYFYNAGGNNNQQIQDIRSLIKNKADVIVVGFTDASSFRTVCMMARDAGIPVVAFDAPEEDGYAINVVADQKAWGGVYGSFVAENLAEGTVTQVLGKQDSPLDAERAAAVAEALAANTALADGGVLYAGWDKQKANEAMTEYLKHGMPDAVITEEGMAEGVLDAFLEKGVLPKVMCGDATAGFIKKWYALKNGGIDISPKPDNKKAKNDAEPMPSPVMFAAQPGEFIVCAQPAPSGIGAAAFRIAAEMAEGRTLKAQGQTFAYTVSTVITEANLAEYYEKVKDKDDGFIVSDVISDETLDALLDVPQDGAAPSAKVRE